MKAENVAPKSILVFASVAEAARPVAGVAAAARAARTLSDAGGGPVWIALPGGGPLPARLGADLERLLGSDTRVAASADLPALVERLRLAGDAVVRAPTLSTRAVLSATGKASDGPVSRWLNRPVSRTISAWLLQAFPGIRPIHATIGTALIAALMLVALILGGGSGLIAGALLFQFASIFDGVDGEIARATWRTSPAGATLDTLVDVATNIVFVAGVTFNLALNGSRPALVAGSIGLLLFVVGLGLLSQRSAGSTGGLSFEPMKDDRRRAGPAGLQRMLVKAAIIVTSRDFFALLFALLILSGNPVAVPMLFATAAAIWFTIILIDRRRVLSRSEQRTA